MSTRTEIMALMQRALTALHEAHTVREDRQDEEARKELIDELTFSLGQYECEPKIEGEPVATVNSMDGHSSTKWLKKLPDGIHNLYAIALHGPHNPDTTKCRHTTHRECGCAYGECQRDKSAN